MIKDVFTQQIEAHLPEQLELAYINLDSVDLSFVLTDKITKLGCDIDLVLPTAPFLDTWYNVLGTPKFYHELIKLGTKYTHLHLNLIIEGYDDEHDGILFAAGEDLPINTELIQKFKLVWHRGKIEYPEHLPEKGPFALVKFLKTYIKPEETIKH